MDKSNKGKAIGIDLGTTYSCVALWQQDRIEIIVNGQGNRITPSMVAFTPNESLVGDAAKYQIATNPHNTVFDTKRLIGRRFSDSCVQKDMALWPFSVVKGDNDKPMIQVQYKGQQKMFAAEQISSMILSAMKNIAEAYLKCDVTKAVVTVPAYFNNPQRQATKDAAMIAGLNVMRIINEPNAAAIAYALHGKICSSTEKQNVLIFDLGGGTFDVSIVTVKDTRFDVKAVGGDTHLGGQDFDNRVVDYFVKEFKRKYKRDMITSPRALRRLRAECERAKRSLSSAVETVIDIDSLFEGIDFHSKMRRAKFEELNIDLFEKCMKIVEQCLMDAKMSKNQIDEVVLVGGSTRIPKVQELLRDFFDGKQLCKSINPDEAVAYGAAVEAARLNGECLHLVLVDVTPLSLGVQIEDGVMSVVLPRNTPIPVRRTAFFTTRFDNQTVVSFPVYQGERAMTACNTLLGEFHLSGIPKARCRVPSIEVTFALDENGIIKASAEQKTAGLKTEVTIATDGLSTEEIDRMLKDAEKFRAEDEEAAKIHLAKKALEEYSYNAKNRLTKAKMRGEMGKAEMEEIERSVNSESEWLDENENATLEELKEKLEELKLKCKRLNCY
eukprot:Gb_20545 [translate_table: standard]